MNDTTQAQAQSKCPVAGAQAAEEMTKTDKVTEAQTKAGCPMAEAKAIEEKIKNTDWALGPGSISWRVLRDPAVFMVGLLNDSLRLPLHPAFAATARNDSFATDPAGRFRRVATFVYMAAYGDVKQAQKVARMVIKSHTMIKGTEPLSQLPYQANSEYELAITLVMQTSGLLWTYEAIYGELSIAERDQFVKEQMVLGAVIGVNPDHVPKTYFEMLTYMEDMRVHFAAGGEARFLYAPFDDCDYPPGTVMGDLPWFKRKVALLAIRSIADMAFLTTPPEEKVLMPLHRKPVLRFKALTKLSMKLFSMFMRSERGGKIFDEFVGPGVAKTFRDALKIDSSMGTELRRAEYVVPDPEPYFVDLGDKLVRNWPGSPKQYRLGGVNGEVGVAKSAPLREVKAS